MRIRGFDWTVLVAVMIAGTVGAGLRWAIGEVVASEDSGGWFVYAAQTDPVLSGTDLRVGTLVPNVVGCLVLGAVVSLMRRGVGSPRIVAAVALGFCGSLTTFSSFAVELASDLDSGRTGNALLYGSVSIALGALAFWLGRSLVGPRVAP